MRTDSDLHGDKDDRDRCRASSMKDGDTAVRSSWMTECWKTCEKSNRKSDRC